MELSGIVRWIGVLVISLMTIPSSAQTLPITWGPLETKRGSLIDILPIRSADFFAVHFTSGLLSSYKVTMYNQLAFTNQQRIKPVTETGFANIESSAYFAGKFYVFLSDRSGTMMALYSQPMFDGEENAPPELRLSYEDVRIGGRPNFQLLLSQNQKFLAITYEIPGRRANRDVQGYALFDSTFSEIARGEFLLPLDGNISTIIQNHITNQGEYLIAVTEHTNRNDRFIGRAWENFKSLHVYKITADSLKEFNVELDDKRIDDLYMSSNDNGIVSMTGLYGRGNNSGNEGVFSMYLDTQKDSVSGYKYSPFDMEIFRESSSSNGMNNVTRRSNNRGEDPQIFGYKLRQIQTLEDDSKVGYIEQYYERQSTNYDSIYESRNGVTTVNNNYYYMDIVVFKLAADGTYLWGRRIAKNQISMNDHGPFSSFIGFNNQKNAYLIFNDNKKNYDDAGGFSRNNNHLFGLNLSPWKNVVALVTVDLNDGKIERKTMFSQKELSAIAVPKAMKVDWKNKEVLLYAVNRNREKFGLISFK